MVSVSEQYEAFPYPERDPEDERKRLIEGSPSNPVEMDHFLWGGARDWSVPLRVLVAGGGTGDGVIQLAAKMARAGRPYEITYVDLSGAARKVAEARTRVRGLEGIRFLTGSLLDAPELGEFEYIDCCGVLHHLPDPAAGFAALKAALAPGGGIGLMVYAPYGRSGVYPLQEAFGALFEGMAPEARLAAARQVMEGLPAGHPFKVNPGLVDHKASDAGFYDLLLHGQDRAYSVSELLAEMTGAGLRLSGFVTPGQYDLARLAPVPEGMAEADQWAVAEKLRGTIKMHIAYAVAEGNEARPAEGKGMGLIPHLVGVEAAKLGQVIAAGKAPRMRAGGHEMRLDLPREAGALIGAVTGRRSLAQIASVVGMDPFSFGGVWAKVDAALRPWGMLCYSRFLV